MKFNVEKTAEEWRSQLGDEAYRILREGGTEPAFTGSLNKHYEEGTYECKGCEAQLFISTSKFDSGCGWPSFDASEEGKVLYKKDTSHGMIRTEILCTNCGGHLGHVFNDGPTETKQRYCVNSQSINFKTK